MKTNGERQILRHHFKWHFLRFVLFAFFLRIVFIFAFCIYFSFEISTVIFGEILIAFENMLHCCQFLTFCVDYSVDS